MRACPVSVDTQVPYHLIVSKKPRMFTPQKFIGCTQTKLCARLGTGNHAVKVKKKLYKKK